MRNKVSKNVEKGGQVAVISACAVLLAPSLSAALHTGEAVTVVSLSAILAALFSLIKQVIKK